MKRCAVGGLTAVLIAGGLVTFAPPASAGCQYGGLVVSKCDRPVQPDGTWQRCVVFSATNNGGRGAPSYSGNRCDLMGPDRHPWGIAFNDPPTHIDD